MRLDIAMNRKPLLRSVLLAVTLATGFGVAWAVVVIWIDTCVRSVLPAEKYETLTIKADGMPVIRTGWEYKDLSGRPVEVKNDERWLNSWALLGPAGTPRWPVPEPWTYRLAPFSDNGRPPTYWYFVCDGKMNGSAYLVGYDSESKERIGIIGPAGFRKTGPSPDNVFSFDGTSRDGMPAINSRIHSLQGGYYAAHIPTWYGGRQVAAGYAFVSAGQLVGQVYVESNNDTVYEIDLDSRTVRKAISGVPYLSTELKVGAKDPQSVPSASLLLRTNEEVLYTDVHGHISRRTRIPPELRNTNLYWGELPDDKILIETMEPVEGGLRYKLYWLNATGQVERQDEAVVHTAAASKPRVLLSLYLPVPLFVDLFVIAVEPAEWPNSLPAGTYGEALAKSVATYWPTFLIVHILGAVLAWLCYRRQILYAASQREKIIWPIFVFLGGLPAWIGYRYCRTWPILERCPDCSALVPQNDTVCPACRGEFPLPALKGTEVIA